MSNPYQAPNARVADFDGGINNSGGGSGIVVPEEVKGWSWGAFLLSWIWAIGNRTWIGLLALIPYVGFLMTIYLGIKGREMAWRNNRWDSIEHFNRVQRSWSKWGVIIFVGIFGISILAAILIPAADDYASRAVEAEQAEQSE